MGKKVYLSRKWRGREVKKWKLGFQQTFTGIMRFRKLGLGITNR